VQFLHQCHLSGAGPLTYSTTILSSQNSNYVTTAIFHFSPFIACNVSNNSLPHAVSFTSNTTRPSPSTSAPHEKTKPLHSDCIILKYFRSPIIYEGKSQIYPEKGKASTTQELLKNEAKRHGFKFTQIAMNALLSTHYVHYTHQTSKYALSLSLFLSKQSHIKALALNCL
jgi:hypothetical protein